MSRVHFIRSLRLAVVTAPLLTALPANAVREQNFFEASRALSMGDAYTAYDVGYEAVYYNPAGVARRSKPEFKLIDLEGVASEGLLGIFSSNYRHLTNFSKIVQDVASNPGNVESIGVSFLPQFLVKNFSVGLVTRAYSEAFTDTTTNDLDLYTFTDVTLYTQFGVSLMGGILKLGVGGKVIDRAEVNHAYTPAEIAAGPTLSSQWQEGVAYGADFGLLLTAPTELQPTLGIALQDIGNTTFHHEKAIFGDTAPGAPGVIKQKLNIGTALNKKFARGIKAVFSAEYKDALNADQSSLQYKLHAGTEFTFKNTLFLRAGVNEGRYWTAGIGVHGGGIGIELATYGENISFNPSQWRDDRKWVGRYVIEF